MTVETLRCSKSIEGNGRTCAEVKEGRGFWFRARRRTIERKKARSGPEDKCLPTRSGAFSIRGVDRVDSRSERERGSVYAAAGEGEGRRPHRADTTGRQDASARARRMHRLQHGQTRSNSIRDSFLCTCTRPCISTSFFCVG